MRCSCIKTSPIPCDCRHSRTELSRARLPAPPAHTRARAEVEYDNCESNDGDERDNGFQVRPTTCRDGQPNSGHLLEIRATIAPNEPVGSGGSPLPAVQVLRPRILTGSPHAGRFGVRM